MSAHIIAPLLSCLGLRLKLNTKGQQQTITSNTTTTATYEPRYTDKDNTQTDTDIDTNTEIAATTFIKILLTAPISDLQTQTLHQTLTNSIKPYTWTESLAKTILTKLEFILSDSSKFGGALKDAFERVTREAVGFARDHPAYCTLIALGILVVIAMPWVLEVLGFAELGPVEGESVHHTFVDVMGRC
jgi:hypothetical protein